MTTPNNTVSDLYAIHIVAFAHDFANAALRDIGMQILPSLVDSFGIGISRIAMLTGSDDHINRNNHTTQDIASTVSTGDELRCFMNQFTDKHCLIHISNPRKGSKAKLLDINWNATLIMSGLNHHNSIVNSWLTPNEGVSCITLRCNSRSFSDRLSQTDTAINLLSQVVTLMNARYAFITCEPLNDTNAGDVYCSSFITPVDHVHLEALSMWARCDRLERHRKIPAIFWGNYFSRDLLDSVNRVVPGWNTEIANWMHKDDGSLLCDNNRQIVRILNTGVFFALSSDVWHDRRDDKGYGTELHCRSLDLAIFIRHMLSSAGVHV